MTDEQARSERSALRGRAEARLKLATHGRNFYGQDDIDLIRDLLAALGRQEEPALEIARDLRRQIVNVISVIERKATSSRTKDEQDQLIMLREWDKLARTLGWPEQVALSEPPASLSALIAKLDYALSCEIRTEKRYASASPLDGGRDVTYVLVELADAKAIREALLRPPIEGEPAQGQK